MKWMLLLFLGSCLTGVSSGWTYHYSNSTMTWTNARKWCQTYYTDMVVVQNQDENAELVSFLPNKNHSPYYWLGITREHKDGNWIWIGNNSTWVGKESWAENEPNNNQSWPVCVELYVNAGANRGKWNDEKCHNRKYAVCYQAQCNATICGRGKCQEAVNNVTCLCEPGFAGNACQTVSTHLGSVWLCQSCDVLRLHPDPRLSVCPLQAPFEKHMCQVLLVSVTPPVECPPMSPPNGYFHCAEGNHTVNSTCRFTCHGGFLRIGSAEVTCGVTANWGGPKPACARKTPGQLRLTEEGERMPSELEG
nr:P-selectin-like [Nerophis lumbriciformis]